ncbi:Nif3-like dinuclear metal center hexameric protein [Natranaerobius trueperi]|nr:Nif3-like dinuclear metal center hexameric protein [Natranaerobius trueperi]
MRLATKKDIINAIEYYAPQKYALSKDNPGTQIGELIGNVSNCIVALDATEEVVDKAVEINAELIISHHPVFMEPLKNLTNKYIGNVAKKAIKNDITIYTSHTNLDVAPHIGVNHALIDTLSLDFKKLSNLLNTYKQDFYKIVVYVPKEYLESLKEIIFSSGGGRIGEYSDCSFSTLGNGTFKPLPGTNPFIGEIEKRDNLDEYRLETIVNSENLDKVIENILKEHPYEEPAYDVYQLEQPYHQVGLGLIGELTAPINCDELLDIVENKLDTRINFSGEKKSYINKIAVCGGSGGKLINQAVASGADAFITGDIKYHEALDAYGRGLIVIDAGHRETELPVINKLVSYLDNYYKNQETNFIAYYNQEKILTGRESNI